MYGLYCCDFGSKQHEDVSFGNRAKIIEERILGRVQPLHFGVNYHDEPLQFTMIFGGDQPIDRYDMQTIAMWLTGHQQYQWLTIEEPDMEGLSFRCLIRELTPISVGWFQYAFSADVICDCPYAYSEPFKQTFEITSGESTSCLLRNFGSARDHIRPVLNIDVADESTMSWVHIINHATGDEMRFDDIPSGTISIIVDNDTGIIEGSSKNTSSVVDVYPYFNFEYIKMASGDNWLEISSDGNIKITFSGRYLHNVGA